MKKNILILFLLIAAVGLGYWQGQRGLDAQRGTVAVESANELLSAGRAGGGTADNALNQVKTAGKVHTVKDGESIQAAVLAAQPGDTIRVMPGTYKEIVYIDKDDIAIVGVISDSKWPTLEGEGTRNDAILYSGNGIRIENLKITHYKGNAIMGQAGNNFVIRHNWIVDTGVYGIFPQFGQNGLIEYNVLTGIEDAAIYVGMCDNIHVAHNEVFGNVAGIEIENSRHAVVENNTAYDNTGGILVFITPGLPIKTTFDVIVRNNFISGNNHPNFGAPGSIVSGLPAGTGIVVMAADDVIIENNIIRDNKNVGIVITDHASFANVTADPESEPNPDRVQILNNIMTGNGTEPITEIKALMTLNLTTEAPDIVAVGGGKDSCIIDRARYRSIGLGNYTECTRTNTNDVASYLLPQPAERRSTDTGNKGKLAYFAICAGCHAYNARMIGPPTLTIQALYADDAQAIADYIANPVKKRPDFPAMPPQSYLDAATRLEVAKFMLTVDK
ncbi:cytochrome-c peroxidase [Permianibacter sp. IMCC34836]|uniref:parallel beta-helix domain-containing protein n=1 Tax=Permianibacter fluminis TaxID=2738515 RepID=UPI0015579E94|nr:parallel beta-helix domain-containing protein [Permianibacter fluminis]NQD38875.1 cytochrome-c peroxidase [Permianibacter fluminis]